MWKRQVLGRTCNCLQISSDSWEPMDCSLSGSSVHGILQARIPEWVAISLSRGSSHPRNRTQVSCIADRFFTELQGKPLKYHRDPQRRETLVCPWVKRYFSTELERTIRFSMLLSGAMNCSSLQVLKGLPQWLSGKESANHAGDSGDTGSIPGSGRSPGGWHGNPLQYSCLENLMDRGGWKPEVYGLQRVEHKWSN